MLQIKINGEHTVLDVITGLQTRLADMRPALMSIGEGMLKSTKRRFETGLDPGGSAWAPNSPVTIELFLREFYAGKTDKKGRKIGPRKNNGDYRKDAAGRLAGKKPLTGTSGMLGETINYQIEGSDTVRIGSPMRYAATQQYGAKKGQFGGKAPWGDIPARPFLGFSDEDQQAIVETIREHLGLT